MKYLIALFALFAVTAAFPDRGSRIINGRDATPGEAPYMVQIQLRNATNRGQMCGGALITASRIVSAAHCFDWSFAPRWTLFAVAGQHNWRVDNGNEQEREITSFVNHPNYNGGLGVFSGFDIAYFDVSTPFTLNQWVQTIALPQANVRHTGNLRIFGWGATQPAGGGIPDVLQTTTKMIVDPALCDEIMTSIFNGRNPINVNDLCAGPVDVSNPTDSCGGDSGGPLVQVNSNGDVELIAVVAWGSSPCNAVNFPSVNTRTSPFIDFLRA